MRKAITLLAAIALGGTMAGYATDYPWLTFKMADNSELSVASANLDMEFSEGKLVLKSGTVNQTLLTKNLQWMKFTSVPASLTEIDGETGEMEVYSAEGMKIGKFSSIQEISESLGKGIYILRSRNSTVKIIL